MKILILCGIIILSGCGSISENDVAAIKACIGKGWIADYLNNGVVHFTCAPMKKDKE